MTVSVSVTLFLSVSVMTVSVSVMTVPLGVSDTVPFCVSDDCSFLYQ